MSQHRRVPSPSKVSLQTPKQSSSNSNNGSVTQSHRHFQVVATINRNILAPDMHAHSHAKPIGKAVGEQLKQSRSRPSADQAFRDWKRYLPAGCSQHQGNSAWEIAFKQGLYEALYEESDDEMYQEVSSSSSSRTHTPTPTPRGSRASSLQPGQPDAGVVIHANRPSTRATTVSVLNTSGASTAVKTVPRRVAKLAYRQRIQGGPPNQAGASGSGQALRKR